MESPDFKVYKFQKKPRKPKKIQKNLSKFEDSTPWDFLDFSDFFWIFMDFYGVFLIFMHFYGVFLIFMPFVRPVNPDIPRLEFNVQFYVQILIWDQLNVS
jgi:hypothetical protein